VLLDPDLASDHKSLCLKDTFSSNLMLVHGYRDTHTKKAEELSGN